MCGIAGIVYNLNKDFEVMDFSVTISIIETLKSLEFNVDKTDEFIAYLEKIEAFVNKLFDYSIFYQLYSNKENIKYLKELISHMEKVEKKLTEYLKISGVSIPIDFIEKINSFLVRLRDLIWRSREDLLGNISKISKLNEMAKFHETRKFIYELWKLNFNFNNIDRLEVRGRDSAGISCMVTFNSNGDLKDFKENLSRELKTEYDKRLSLDDFVDSSILETEKSIIFAFKVAAEIGKLGDNVSTLRKHITSDMIFLKALSLENTGSSFFTHTRWASNGIINEQNCHPVNSEAFPLFGFEKNNDEVFYISAALNGDIDNFQELKERYTASAKRRISENITTDTKIIPLMVERFYEEKGNMEDAFRLALNEFKGSMAIVMHNTLDAGKIYLALRGSGQALFVGLINKGYVFASEIYGLVEESSRFLKIDGEKERVPGDLSTQGQIFILDQSSDGGLENIKAMYFDGVPVKLTEEHIKKAEITTRDINRGSHSHFLVKEISESPLSVEKTFRGKFEIKQTSTGVTPIFNINTDIVPQIVISKLKAGDIKKIYIIGQGTASIAANGIADVMSRVLYRSPVQIISTKSTELSGFLLEDNMSHVLVIAVSQSGTTTDTNRTVDLLRARGSHVIAIVNRRNSDLVYKSDGVFYTSDGRDIEMSVASTKAFYSQVVSGTILSLYFAHILSTMSQDDIVAELNELKALPEKMFEILDAREEIKKVADEFAVTRKYWAVVGSGPNKVAGDEIRIKLSELCYKSIASDTTEDKKHIDLSSEPLIIVCVAGVTGSNLQDMVKEVAIFKAHKACPIIIVSRGQEELFKPYASAVLSTPRASSGISMLLNTMVGHLWGYYAARSIEESSNLLKSIRVITVDALTKSSKMNVYQDRNIIKALSRKLYAPCNEFYSLLKKGRYNSCLEVHNATQLSLLFKYLQGKISIDDFELDFSKIGTLGNILNEAVNCLSSSIADLTRPIDAIKHQAKTVTVGISRLEEVPEGVIFDRLKEENISLGNITYQNIFVLQSITPSVETITGCTKYDIIGLDSLGYPSDTSRIIAVYKSGIASNLMSRADKGTLLIGRKKSVVAKNKIFIGKGSLDERAILIIPLVDKGICHKLILFHVDFKKDLHFEKKVILLKALDKYDDVKYVVTEMNIPWDDRIFDKVPVGDLISEDPDAIAEWIACSQ